MIKLYSGLPGSGKSYKMVYDLAKCKDDYFVIHNIEGLKDDYLTNGFNFEIYCQNEKIEVIEFFSKDYQVELQKAIYEKYNKNMLIIIDECHEWFDKNVKGLKMWMSYHRHLNQEVWLVSHGLRNISSAYRSYIGEEYQAKHSSVLQMPGYFFYNKYLQGHKVGMEFAKKKDEIFKLYKSMKEGFKKQRPSLYLPIMMLVVAACLAYFVMVPQKLLGGGKKVEQNAVKQEIMANNQAITNQNVDYVFAGMFGNIPLVQEISSKRIMKVSEIPNGDYMVMKITENSIVLFNTNDQKLVSIKKYSFQKISESSFNSEFKK